MSLPFTSTTISTRALGSASLRASHRTCSSHTMGEALNDTARVSASFRQSNSWQASTLSARRKRILLNVAQVDGVLGWDPQLRAPAEDAFIGLWLEPAFEITVAEHCDVIGGETLTCLDIANSENAPTRKSAELGLDGQCF